MIEEIEPLTIRHTGAINRLTSFIEMDFNEFTLGSYPRSAMHKNREEYLRNGTSCYSSQSRHYRMLQAQGWLQGFYFLLPNVCWSFAPDTARSTWWPQFCLLRSHRCYMQHVSSSCPSFFVLGNKGERVPDNHRLVDVLLNHTCISCFSHSKNVGWHHAEALSYVFTDCV